MIMPKALPGYVPISGVIHRRENGFVLQVGQKVIVKMALDGWTITRHGPYILATCPPMPLPEIPTRKQLDRQR